MVATLLFVDFADEWFTFLPSGALESIRADLHLSYGEVALILVALSAGGLLGQGLIIAADFFSRRLLAGGGALGYAGCLFAFAAGDSLVILLIAAFVWGAASDGFTHATQVALVDLSGDDLARTLARVNALGSVGDLLGPAMLVAGAALGMSWRELFAISGGLMLLYAVVILVQRFPPPHPPEDAKSPLASVLAVARDRRVIILAIIVGLFALLDEPLVAFVIAHLEVTHDLPLPIATAVGSTLLVGGLIGFVSVPFVTARVSDRPLLLACSAIMAVSLAVVVVTPIPAIGPVIQIASALVFGAVWGVFYTVLQATYLGLRPGQAGATEAVVSAIGLIGMGYPALVGAVADRFGLLIGLGLYLIVPAVMLVLLLRSSIAATTATESEEET